MFPTNTKMNKRWYSEPTSNPELKRIADCAEEYTNSKKFKTYVLRHPFKAYCRTGSVAFGLIFLGNLVKGITNSNPIVSPYESPQTFFSINFFKSLWFGFLWPTIPFMLTTPDNRERLFVVGNSFNEMEKITTGLEKRMKKNK